MQYTVTIALIIFIGVVALGTLFFFSFTSPEKSSKGTGLMVFVGILLLAIGILLGGSPMLSPLVAQAWSSQPTPTVHPPSTAAAAPTPPVSAPTVAPAAAPTTYVALTGVTQAQENDTVWDTASRKLKFVKSLPAGEKWMIKPEGQVEQILVGTELTVPTTIAFVTYYVQRDNPQPIVAGGAHVKATR